MQGIHHFTDYLGRREVEPTTWVKNRLVKFLADAGFISSKASTAADAGT
jgi:hypothetical protein